MCAESLRVRRPRGFVVDLASNAGQRLWMSITGSSSGDAWKMSRSLCTCTRSAQSVGGPRPALHTGAPQCPRDVKPNRQSNFGKSRISHRSHGVECLDARKRMPFLPWSTYREVSYCFSFCRSRDDVCRSRVRTVRRWSKSPRAFRFLRAWCPECHAWST